MPTILFVSFLCLLIRSGSSNINNNTSLLNYNNTEISNMTKITTKHVRVISNRSLPQSYSSFLPETPPPRGLEFDQIIDPVEKYLKSLEKHGSRLKSTVSQIEQPNTDHIYFMDFEPNVINLVSFEPKTGMIELDLQLIYKWWHSSDETLDYGHRQTSAYYPGVTFRDKQAKLVVKNQLHTIDNIQVMLDNNIGYALDEHQLLDKLERFKLFPPQIQQLTTLKPEPKRKRTMFRHFSKLEQNVTIKFNCKKPLDDEFTDDIIGLDTSRFPFDSHMCELELDLVPIEPKPSLNKTFNPIFMFSASKLNKNMNRMLVETDFNNSLSTSFLDLYWYNNKIVQIPNNYSLISREWMLKKVAVFYSNATSPFQTKIDSSEKYDQILMSNRLNDSNSTNSIQPAGINIRFFVYRRREPQVYVFLLPLLLFTSITFLIFFLPTTPASEKSLITFLNFAFLLAYNLYLFKLIIYEYEFQRMPLLLQYSNCLMVIQLGVLAYTCLVKSVYHQGFLTFSGAGGYTNASFASLAEHAYRQIAILTYQEMNQSKKRELMFQHQQHHQNQESHQSTISNGQMEAPVYGSVDDETTTTHLCDKVEVSKITF